MRRSGAASTRRRCRLDLQAIQHPPDVDMLALDEALSRLEAIEPRWSRLIELRFFAGSVGRGDRAAALELSPATVKRDWSLARAWLYREIGTGGNDEQSHHDGAMRTSSEVRAEPEIAAELRRCQTSDRWARVRTVLEELVGRPGTRAYGLPCSPRRRARDTPGSRIPASRARQTPESFLESASLLGRDARPTIRRPRPPAAGHESRFVRDFRARRCGRHGAGLLRAGIRASTGPSPSKSSLPISRMLPASRERFEREARAISKLTHPHICVLHDVGIADLGERRRASVPRDGAGGRVRLFDERLDAGALPLNQALRYAIQIADALAAAHSQQDRPWRSQARQYHADEVRCEAAGLRARELPAAGRDAN